MTFSAYTNQVCRRAALRLLATAILLGISMDDISVGAETPQLKAGARIVFLGDSITQAGAGPGGYVTLVREALDKQKPDLKIEVIGAGISGNKVPDLEARLERDVLSKKPTLVVIYIGINDVWHSTSGKGTAKDVYEKGLRSLIKRINDAGARVILCTASVIGEKHDGSNPLDKMLDEYCDVSRKVAADTGSQLIDLRKQFLAHLKEHNAQNADRGILTPDTVHLNAAGNQFVAARMLEGLGVGSPASGLLRHVVLMKFKSEVSSDQVQEIVATFSALPTKIDAIHSFECGTDVSVENKAEGFTHCFLVTFRDAQGRDAYLPHAAHQEFVSLVRPRLDKVLVFDYVAK